jgi:hypothetical protein
MKTVNFLVNCLVNYVIKLFVNFCKPIGNNILILLINKVYNRVNFSKLQLSLLYPPVGVVNCKLFDRFLNHSWSKLKCF